jgi:hypothetical protein
MAKRFSQERPTRDFIVIYYNTVKKRDDYYNMSLTMYYRYIALYGTRKDSGRWIYPEFLPVGQKVYG